MCALNSVGGMPVPVPAVMCFVFRGFPFIVVGWAVHLGDTPRLGIGARAGVVGLGMVDGAGCGDGARFIWADVDRRSLSHAVLMQGHAHTPPSNSHGV